MRRLTLIAVCLLAGSEVASRAETASAPAPAADFLATGLQAVRAAPAGEARRAAAMKVVEASGPAALDALSQRLAIARTSTDDERRAALARFNAEVPTPDGKFKTPPPPKKGETPPPPPDWLSELAAIDDPGAHDTLEIVILLRALAGTQRFAAADAILHFAFTPEGVTFRDECGRQLRALSPYSLPTLLRASQDKQRDKGSFARYSSYQLEKLDKARPSYALGAAPDPEVEIAILTALGDAKHPDAVPVVLDRCDARGVGVRRAARSAFLAYVTGPPPPPAPKAKRKMPGGKMSEEELPLYLTYRELAVLELKRRLDELGATYEKRATAEALALQIFELWDQRRVAQFGEAMDAARLLAGEGKWAEATARYDGILAVEPLLPRRTEMAPSYLAVGRSLAEADRWPDAVVALEKAYSLDPAGPAASEAQAALHFARAQVLEAAGQPPRDELELTLGADPEHEAARSALATHQQAEARAQRKWMLWAGAGTAAAAVLLVLLAVARRR